MHETKGVAELHGFEVAEGDPDVRGWEVVSRDGRRIGEVEQLLVDPENASARYLEVRLDPLSGDGEVIGQDAVPGDGPPEMPARTIGEALVRDSLLDIENQMTSGGRPGFDRGAGRTLIPAGQAHFDTGRRQIRIESLPVQAG